MTDPGEFYVTGGSLSADAPSYVERSADTELFEGLRRGEFCYVLTSRQMGKSSLMIRTATRLRAEGIVPVVLDFTAIGQNLAAEQWYYGLLDVLGERLDLFDALDAYWSEHSRLGPMQRFMRAIREVVLPHIPGPDSRLVIFMDEIDVVRSLPFSTDELFAALRECYMRRNEDPELQRLTFCLMGVAAPSDLIRDTRMTPFNIGRRIELSDFTVDEAAGLDKGLGGGVPLSPDSDQNRRRSLLKRILFWTGGHPYLTQRFCMAVRDELVKAPDSGVDCRTIDRICSDLFLSHRAQHRDDNLIFVRERVLRAEVDPAALLELYNNILRGKPVGNDDTNRLVDVLRLSGISRVRNGRLIVRNRIYEQVFNRSWIRTHMPGAELQRQNTAYRRGLFFALGISSAVLAAMVALAAYGFIQADRAERNAGKERIARKDADTNASEREFALIEARGQRNAAITARKDAIHRAADALAAARRETEARNAESAAHKAETGAKNDAIRTAKRARAAEALATRNADEAYANLYYADMNLMETAWGIHDVGHINKLLDDTHRYAERNFEWGYWNCLCHSELMTLSGPRGTGGQVAFSLDGKKIVSRGARNSAAVWDAATGRLLLNLRGHTSAVSTVAFSHDSRRIITGGTDHTAKGWDAVTGQALVTFRGHSSEVSAAAFSPDAKWIVTGESNKTAKIWNAVTGEERLTLRGHSDLVVYAAYSPDGTRVATFSVDGYAKFWDAGNGHEISSIRHDDGECCLYDGKRIIIGHLGGRLTVQVAETGQMLVDTLSQSDNDAAGILCVALSSDGRRIGTGSFDGVLQVRDADTGRILLTQAGHTHGVKGIAFSPDGKCIVTGSADDTLKIWDSQRNFAVQTLPETRRDIKSVAYFGDNRRIVTAAQDGTAKVWDLATGLELLTLKGRAGNIMSVAVSNNGRRIVTGSMDKKARVWDAETGDQLLALEGHVGGIHSVTFSRDGKHIVTASRDKTAKVWDAQSGRECLTLRGHRSMVTCSAYSSDGRKIVTGSVDTTARVWDAASGQELLILRGQSSPIASIAISSDSSRVVTGGTGLDNTARVWDAATGKELATLKGHTAPIMSVAISPDGKQIVTGSLDSTCKLWDMKTGRELLSMGRFGKSGGVFGVAFSPDGRAIAIVTNQTTTIVRSRFDRPSIVASK